MKIKFLNFLIDFVLITQQMTHRETEAAGRKGEEEREKGFTASKLGPHHHWQ